ncbi:MAG: phosphotransferase [bacterium]
MNILEQLFGSIAAYNCAELTRGASTRKYYRVTGEICKDYSCDSLIISHFTGYAAGGFKTFLEIHDILKTNGINVPDIYFVREECKALAMEDLGDSSLEILCTTMTEPEIAESYKSILDDLAAMQKIDWKKYEVFKKPFDRGHTCIPIEDIYLYDLTNHTGRFLLRDYFKCGDVENELLIKFYNIITRELVPNIKKVMYRDFQSSNIFLHKKKKKFYYIDFQDSRLGIPHYDLASILWDCYTAIDPHIRSRLAEYYIDKCSYSRDDFFRTYEFCVIQRKLHDAGAFANAFINTGKGHLERYIRPAIADAVGLMRRYREFSRAGDFFNGIIQRDKNESNGFGGRVWNQA